MMSADTNGNVPYSNETPKDERIAVLKNDTRQGQPMPTQGSTYLSRAVAEAGSELGRWRHLSEQTIVGARGPQPTSYAQMAKEREQQLELDATTTGHDALRLQAERGKIPQYPQQPGNVWNVDAGNTEPAFPTDISALPDMETISGKPRAKAET
jgi:hypothetical protein